MSARSGLVGKRTSRLHLGPSRAIFCVGRKNAKMPKFCLFSLVGPCCYPPLVGLLVIKLPILVPGSWYQDLGTKILVPSSWCQDLGTKILVPESWYENLGTVSWCHLPNVSCHGILFTTLQGPFVYEIKFFCSTVESVVL